MKLSTTTPASITFLTRVCLVVVSLLIMAAMPIQIAQNVFADQYDDKIRALQQEISKYQAEGQRLNKEAVTLKSALAQLSNEKAAIQAQIDLNQVKYNRLVAQIVDTEKKIKDSQDALGVTIANMYVDDKISPIEMLASSNNISDYLDKQEYRASVRNELTSMISKIKELKEKLVTKKAEVGKVLANQKTQRDALVAKESEKSGLLRKTQGDEAGYQRLISDSRVAIAEARATQALLNSRINGSGGFTIVDAGSLGGYPWNYLNCPMVGYMSSGGADGSGGDGRGYGCRQCASYVAWKIAKETGLYPSWGNAVNFTASAVAAGFPEGAARAGSIAVMDPGKAGQSFGHVAWVEAVSGGSVLISQYNYDYGSGYGMYSKMWLSASAFDHYVHIK